MIDDLSQLILSAPFHRWLGIEMVEQRGDTLELAMPWREEIISNSKSGSAHGGILASLIDLTGYYTIISAGGIAKSTVDLRIDYHRPATTGPLRAVGQVIKVGRTISTAETRILDMGERLLASGRGTYLSA